MPQSINAPIVSQLANHPDMAELIDLFVSELPSRVDSVAQAWQSKELTGLRRLAHQLKGSCAGYGFPVLGDAAGKLEKSLDSQAALNEVAGQVNELIELCRRAAAPQRRAA